MEENTLALKFIGWKLVRNAGNGALSAWIKRPPKFGPEMQWFFKHTLKLRFINIRANNHIIGQHFGAILFSSTPSL